MYSINNSGQIVGDSWGGSGSNHAVLYNNGAVTSLSSILNTTLGMQNCTARVINDAGQIIGEGQVNGQYHAFLMTPISDASCTYALSPASSAQLNYAGDTATVSVGTASNCQWSTSLVPSWVNIISGSPATGAGTVSYSVGANQSSSVRTATMTIAGQVFTVNQQARPCTYSLSPTQSPLLAGTGATGSFTMTTQDGCAWSVSAVPSWATITSGASGTGTGTINYSVPTNPTQNARLGALTANGNNVYIQQNGNVQTCSYSITPTSKSIPSTAQSLTVNVSTQAGCSWSTSGNNIMWVRIASSSLGTNGQGYVTFSISANTAPASRTNAITIAGKTFSLTQAKQGQ